MPSPTPKTAARRRRPRKAGMVLPQPLPDNVVFLHQRLTPRHAALLARWLDAGRRMGLCDASAFSPEPNLEAGSDPALTGDYVLVWVRENSDPAYMVIPDRSHWIVVDTVRNQNLARLSSFAAALHFIRPVLPLEAAA